MIRKMMGAAAMVATTVSAAEAIQPPQPPAAAQAPALPASPVDPARLAAAQRMVAAMWPDAGFEEAMGAGLRDGVAEYTRPDPHAEQRDPHHAERMRLTVEATTLESRRMLGVLVPEIRTLAARYYARSMSLAEIEEAARFYATPAGQRFAVGSFVIFADPAAARAFSPPNDPALMAAFGRIGTRIDTATAHLRPQRPPAPAASDEEEFEAVPLPDETLPPPPMGVAPPAPPPPPPRMPVAEHEIAPPAPPTPPPLPPVDPARLAAARSAAALIWPDEAFSQPLPLPRLLATVLAIPLSTFGDMLPLPPGPDRNGTVGDFLGRTDPNFREGATIAAGILSEELPRTLPLIAPHFRTGVAELYARRFSEADLADASRFYASPAGRAVARNSFSPMVDPEFVQGLILLAPRLIAQGTAAMARVRQATAHLPPPRPAPAPKHDDHDEDDHDHDSDDQDRQD